MKAPKFGIFFDWSGTLSNDLHPVFLANNMVLKSYGKQELSYEAWLSYCCGNATEFARTQGIMADDVQTRFKSFFQQVTTEKLAEPTPYDFTSSTLRILKELGYTLTIISSHPQEPLEKEVEKYGVISYFDKIIGSIFDKSITINELCQEFQIPKENTIYIGDTIHDMRAAKKANVISVAVWNGYHSKEVLSREQPTYLLENASHLIPIATELITR